MKTEPFDIVTVTLNPAIDQTVTIPNFTTGVVNRVASTSAKPGGKGVNVASLLGDAGHLVAVTGFLGNEDATLFEELFTRKHMADRFVRIAGETRVGIKIVDPERNQTTDINFPGLGPTPSDYTTFVDLLATFDARLFVLAGSLPPGTEPDTYQRLTTFLKERGRRVAIDTSGEPLRHALAAKPHIFKPNIHELGELLGRTPANDREVVEAARELIAGGIETVVVSLGKDGACFVTASDAILARPPAIPVHSTVGAGDAMVAGIISAQIRELPLAECARVATAFSLHALSGATTDLTASVRTFLPQISIHSVV